MIGPGSDAKVLICTYPVDFRKGIDSLVALVQHEFHQDPFAGVVYIFRSKRADRMKILWWDGSGIFLMTKRLEDGRFLWPQIHDGTYRINAQQMAALVGGYQWQKVHRNRRVNRPKVELFCEA
jgi:transposase